MSIIRNINSITDLKRGSTNLNFVYRGSILIWQRSTLKNWLTNGLSLVLASNRAGQNVWVTDGLNLKYR